MAGIRVGDGDTIIRGNIVGWTGKESGEYATGAGIVVIKSSCSVQHNWVWGNKYGMIIGGTTADHSVTDNFVEQNDQYGIWMTSIKRSLVFNNRIRMGAHFYNLQGQSLVPL